MPTPLQQNPPLTPTIFYITTLPILFLHLPHLPPPFILFTKLPRISLTSYFLHSIIPTLLFLNYGPDLVHPL
ncbi:DUF418 domain-containing protein, partial [Bacillus pumilus]|uniref:DUF418 domain-containing protein n=1 Tax=Bacillus pumilus TaxID=1408 RepID=UPI0034D962B2